MEIEDRDINASTDLFNLDEDNLENITGYIKEAIDDFLQEVNGRPVVPTTLRTAIFPEGQGDLRFWIGVQLAP